MIKKSTHLAELSFGGTTETVLVRDVQWDHLGKEIIHLDFARVSADESIETEVRLDVRGTAAGDRRGGRARDPRPRAAGDLPGQRDPRRRSGSTSATSA